ncbi:MAG: ABC transporter permease [Syntrophobacterales bacterium]|nr:ABC transporter permease [Syntrophobacterales bacterium]
MNIKRIIAISHKEWREIVRDRFFLALAFVVPSTMLLVFGYGLILDVENIPFCVVDYDKTPTSRDYIYRFIGSRYFNFRGTVEHEELLRPLFEASKIRFALIIPEHFERDLRAGRSVTVQSLIDGVFPFRAATSKGYVLAMNRDFNGEILADYFSKKFGIPLDRAFELAQPVRIQLRYLYNQELRSTWSIASAMIMFVLMVSPPFLTAMGVVREKESGSIYNIYCSTVTRGEFIVGKLVPYVFISVLNSLILWAWTKFLFGAPFKGDPVFFFFASVVYVICTTGIGLLVSLMVRTQVAAMMVTIVLTVVPSVLYSGLFIPISSMEPIGQFQSHLFPAMYFTDIVLGSFLKGVGIKHLWDRVVALALYAGLLWVISFMLFSKRPRS